MKLKAMWGAFVFLNGLLENFRKLKSLREVFLARGRLSGPMPVEGVARTAAARRRRERHTAMTGRRWFRDKKTNKVGPMVGERQQNA